MTPVLAHSHHSHGIYEDVFTEWFASEQYQFWKRDDITWQLRCIGSPGSGKTTFSSLVVKDLERSFGNTNTAILSVFLQVPTGPEFYSSARNICQLLLAEIQEQLDSSLAEHDNRGAGSNKILNTATERVNVSGDDLDNYRNAILPRLKVFDRAFLIIDDIDVVSTSMVDYLALENEFTVLKGMGMKVLTTSRIPFKLDLGQSVCDVDKEHAPLDLWWECSSCLGDDYSICDACKRDGHRCRKPEHGDIILVQPHKKVHLDISNPPLRGLVRYFLEQEHGDLGFKSHVNLHGSQSDLPPLSNLGKELISPVNEDAADELVTQLSRQSGGNITLALLRLENISEVDSLEEARAIADRLPRNIVAAFNAGMSRLSSQPPGLRRDLGIMVVQIVGSSGDRLGLDFIKEKLLNIWKGDARELANLLDSEFGQEEILAASNGFLSLGESKRASLESYHNDFHLYIAENYAEPIFDMQYR